MSQRCLKCLKYTMCAVNLICWLCGASVLGFGIYLMMNSKLSSLIPTLASLNIANSVVIIGTIVTCISFLGFLGALKENRCLLVSYFILLFILMLVELSIACVLLIYESKIDNFFEKDLMNSLELSRELQTGDQTNKDDWNKVQRLGCYEKFKVWFEDNFLSAGAGMIGLCIIEVLGMCFSMTLFCHISRSGLGYK